MNTINDDYLFSNAKTFEAFDVLVNENRDPKLAVTRNGRVIIYSKIETKILAKIAQFVRAIFYKLQFLFGSLKADDAAIQQLRGKVEDFYLKKAEALKNGTIEEIKNLELVNKNLLETKKTLEMEIKATEPTVSEHKKTVSDYEDISKKLKSAKADLESINLRLEEKGKFENKIIEAIKKLESKYKSLLTKKAEMLSQLKMEQKEEAEMADFCFDRPEGF